MNYLSEQNMLAMFGGGIVRGHEDENDDDEESSFSDDDDDDDDVFNAYFQPRYRTDHDIDGNAIRVHDRNFNPTFLNLDTRMRVINHNDPRFTRLEVGLSHDPREGCLYIPTRCDWAGLGRVIGRSKYLTNLSFHLDSWRNFFALGLTSQAILEFIPGFILNRSIQKLCIGFWDLSEEEILNDLIIFFKDNHALECLQVVSGHRDGEGNNGDDKKRRIPLESAVRSFFTLKEFTLDNDPNTKFCVDGVIDALYGHTCLRKLSLSGVKIGMKGCVVLANMRQNPMSNLTTLHLHNSIIDREGMIFFAGCLFSYSTLKVIKITSAYNALGRLHYIDVWRPIFTALQKSNLKLYGLDFSGNNISDNAMVPLSRALQYHSATIKNLSLSDISGINTTAGWRTIIQLLRDPDSALETLDLNGNNITDEGVADIKNALVNNSRLKELNLNHNRRVTANEWINFSDVLLNPISSLEVLGLCNSCINDNVMFSFAVALSNNQRLRELNLHLFDDPDNEHVSSDGFAAFTRILCNNSSILSTYYSNHTLEQLDNTIGFLPDDLETLLILNNKTTKSQVARIKVILGTLVAAK